MRKNLESFGYPKFFSYLCNIKQTKNKIMDIISEINKLRAIAKENGLSIRFHNKRTKYGDFCIFIYDKPAKKRYMTCVYGNWNNKTSSFNVCLLSAYKWIENRDARYTKINGKWVYLK